MMMALIAALLCSRSLRYGESSINKGMAGTTGIEPATSAVTALRELVLQQLTRTRGLPNTRKSYKTTRIVLYKRFLRAVFDRLVVRFVPAHHAVVLQL